MTRPTAAFLLLTILAGCTGEGVNSNRGQGDDPLHHPNFLVIITEDISPMLPCYGDSTIHTPNISRIASRGIVYTNAYSTSGVCAPSRSALITGMYPSSNGSNHMRTRRKEPFPGTGLSEYEVVMPEPVRCFTEYLREAGYYCTNRGKRDWQFGKPLSAFNDYGKEGAHYRNRKPGQPFLSVFNIFCTHESMVWQNSDKPLSCDPDLVNVPAYYPDTDTVRTDIARVYSNIIQMDSILGTMLDELEKDRLLDSTYIIFLSDHGGPLPRQKREILASGLNIPLIVCPPGGQPEQTSDSNLVSLVDLGPTILSLAHVEVPGHMHGTPFLGEQKGAAREYVFGARDRIDSEYDRARSVCDGRYLYVSHSIPGKPWVQDIEYREQMPTMQQLRIMHQQGSLDSVWSAWFAPEKPAEMLFDLGKDPCEFHNLAGDPQYRETMNRHRLALQQWQQEYGDLGTTPESELVESWWPGYRQPQTAIPEFLETDHGITITCATPGSSVVWCKTTPGNLPDPTEPNQWQLYTVPVGLQPGEILCAVANRIGYKNSEMITYGEESPEKNGYAN